MKSIIVIFLVLIFSACGTKKINGLKLDSYHFVKRSDIKNYIGEDMDIPIINRSMLDDFIVLNVMVGEGIVRYVKKRGPTFFMRSFFCEDRETHAIFGLGAVYTRGISSSDPYKKDTFFGGNPEDKYQFILFVSWKEDRELPSVAKKIPNKNTIKNMI